MIMSSLSISDEDIEMVSMDVDSMDVDSWSPQQGKCFHEDACTELQLYRPVRVQRIQFERMKRQLTRMKRQSTREKRRMMAKRRQESDSESFYLPQKRASYREGEFTW